MGNITNELEYLKARLLQKKLPAELNTKAERMIDRLSAAEQASTYSMQDLEIVSKYIDWITKVPFNAFTQDNLDLDNAKKSMNNSHYGLDGVKERILEYIATKKLKNYQGVDTTLNPNEESGITNLNSKIVKSEIPHSFNDNQAPDPVLCFIGVQGVGKTTLAKAIANALGRSFVRIALGAFASVHEIRGLSKAVKGSEPGQIIKSLITAQTMNPVILLDELDKVSQSSGLRADIMAALLEILDPAQNKQFTDRYIDYPIDLSQVMFIATANNLGGISAALLDRLELIRFSSYTDEDKQKIGKNYLLPKVRKLTGIKNEQMAISEDVWPLIIRPFGMDPGIRGLERTLNQLARKVAKMIVEGYRGQVVITPDNFREFIPEKIDVYT